MTITTSNVDISVANDLMICESFLNEVHERAKLYFGNRAISLDDRWDLWCKVGPFIGIKKWNAPRLRTVPSEFFEEESQPFGLSRYMELDVSEMYWSLKDFAEGGDFPSDEVEEWARDANFSEIKEEILQNYLWSFRMDW